MKKGATPMNTDDALATGYVPVATRTKPPVCSHGMPWASPCAGCGRGYPHSGPSITNVVDLTPILERLDRIEAALRRLEETDT